MASVGTSLQPDLFYLGILSAYVSHPAQAFAPTKIKISLECLRQYDVSTTAFMLNIDLILKVRIPIL